MVVVPVSEQVRNRAQSAKSRVTRPSHPKMSADAVKILAKVCPLKFKIESALARDNVKLVPKQHRVKMKHLLQEINDLEVAAQATISKQHVLKCLSLGEVMEKCSEAQKHVGMVVCMRNSLAVSE